MPPQVAILTPAGRGAVATIGIRGAGAVDLVCRCVVLASNPPLDRRESGSVSFGRLALAHSASEEVVIGLIGAEHVEVHCHGGVAAAEAVMEALIAAGSERKTWQEWLQNESPDPLAAAALCALARAPTQRTAAILLDQFRGALGRELAAIDVQIAAGDGAAAAERIRSLLARADLGLHLTSPWRIVAAGRPNAGKSSLVNALLGYQRAIVFPGPGTTRDVLTATTAFDGWPVELSDTAGLRQAGDEIESAGVERAQAAIQAADLVLFVADTTAGWDDVLFEQINATARRLLLVHNKCDLAPPPDDRPAGIAISAKTGAGLDHLAAAIITALVPMPPPAGAAVPFTVEQVDTLNGLAERINGRVN
jgi:tRNA modification GTPase